LSRPDILAQAGRFFPSAGAGQGRLYAAFCSSSHSLALLAPSEVEGSTAEWISWKHSGLRFCGVSDTSRDDLAALRDLFNR
jgi:hypothetical protein